MSEPIFNVVQGVYTCFWQDPEQVMFEFDLFHNDVRKGELSAEVTAWFTEPSMPRRLHRARVTLTSTLSRQTLAKHLSGLEPAAAVNWQDLVGQASDMVLDRYRDGVPAILLRDAEEPPGSTWILPPVVLARHPTILFGDGGVGKSLLALAAGLAIHTGHKELLGIEPTARLKVGFLDWEFDAWEHKQRARALMGEDLPDLVYIPCYGPIRDQVDRLRRAIKEHDLGFLVIDSVGAACGGEPENAEVALTFFDALRRLGLGCLCVAHVKKNGKDQDRQPFGSAFFHNMARATWLVKKQQDLSSQSIRVGLYNKKSNTGPLAPPISYQIEFGEHSKITRQSIYDTPELAAHTSATQRIRHAVQAKAKTYKELAEETGIEISIIRARVQDGVGTLFTRWTDADTNDVKVGLLAHVNGTNGTQPTASSAAREPESSHARG